MRTLLEAIQLPAHIGNHIVTRASYHDAAAGNRYRIGRGSLVPGGALEAVGGFERRSPPCEPA